MAYIEGKNSIIETINSGNKIKKIFVQTGLKMKELDQILSDIKNNGATIKYVDKSELDKMSQYKKHKGLIAEVDDYKYSDIYEILDYAKSKNEPPFIIILDEIEDPHNLGAIVRTADAAGVHGIIIKDRNSCQVNSTVVSSSSGATNYVKIAKVNNISRAIEELKKNNIWVYATDMDGVDMRDIKFDGAVALVIGNEGSGISRLVREKSDFIVGIPMKGKINSLNASVAAAILMYEVVKYR